VEGEVAARDRLRLRTEADDPLEGDRLPVAGTGVGGAGQGNRRLRRGYKKRFTLVTSAVELTGLQMMELFAARFRQEDGFRDLKQRLGWEECRAWTANPIERTSQAQWVTMSLLRLLQFRLEASGEVGWWLRPPWNKDKDRPSVLNAERLMRRHRAKIQRLLSKWAGDEGKTEGDAA